VPAATARGSGGLQRARDGAGERLQPDARRERGDGLTGVAVARRLLELADSGVGGRNEELGIENREQGPGGES